MSDASVRVDQETHEELKRLARRLGVSVPDAVALAAQALRQKHLGPELGQPLPKHEEEWLDADFV